MLALLVPGLQMGGGTGSSLVSVPNVVGESQAQATTDITGAGLVLGAVTTANSSTVAAGLVISQSPVGGTLAASGSAVDIVVSLGDVPASAGSGGWPIFNLRYEQELARRRKRERERRELEEETERIDETVTREIATLLRVQEAKDDRRDELQRLKTLAEGFAQSEAGEVYGDRVAQALERAIRQGNFSALEALDREIGRARREDEDFLLLAITMILGSD